MVGGRSNSNPYESISVTNVVTEFSIILGTNLPYSFGSILNLAITPKPPRLSGVIAFLNSSMNVSSGIF